MKKTLSFILFALLFAAGPLMSQKQLYFGVGGTILSPYTIHQNNYGIPFLFDEKMTSAKGAGNINIGFDFNNHLGLKVEIGVATLGQDYNDKSHGTNGNNDLYARSIKMNYMQIPLLFKYRTGGAMTKFYLAVGPQFSFLTSATQTYTKNGTAYVNDTVKTVSLVKFNAGADDVKSRYNSMDIMARLDVGVDIIIVKHLLLNVGVTMAYGLTDINATDFRIKDYTGNYNASHNAYAGLNLGLCYLLPIGSK
ncbi:MAG: porin family protein [Bacteroidota bacterium]